MNSIKRFLVLSFFVVTTTISAQVKIGDNSTSIGTSSALELESTNKALLVTRVANTSAITNPVNGMIVYDLSSNCIKSYENGAWTNCLSSAPATPSVVANCDANGFVGTYESGVALSGASYSVTITNNSFSTAVINFVSGDLVLSGVSGMTVGTPTGVPALSGGNATLNAGQSVVVTYPITGTPASCGIITGTWTKLSLSCIKTVNSGDSDFVLPATNVVRSGDNITSFTANWSAVGATNYTVEYSTSQSGPWTAFPANPYTGTSAASGTLPGARTYWLRVTANGGLCSGSADIRAVGCGAFVSAGVWKEFLCHNLGANTSLDPHDMAQTNAWGLNGAYIQWGRRGPNTTGDSRVDWVTAPNNGSLGFAAAPTGSTAGTANSDSITGWSSSATSDFSWRTAGGVKTANDPCPAGYRVPTSAEWQGVVNNNTTSLSGVWTESDTNYSSAIHFGPNASTKVLTLPAAGFRHELTINVYGLLAFRGRDGLYWSSTISSTAAVVLQFNSSLRSVSAMSRLRGATIRCIAE